MKRSELLRTLSRLEGFASPKADLEQVATPAEAAATLLEHAVQWGDLGERSVLDLGCGTGILAIGAALLGARTVVGIDVDGSALEVARRNAERCQVAGQFEISPVEACTMAAETVVMNPPFGAQRRHADRPFWEAAYRLASRRIYAFALAPSRSFIARGAVARGAKVEATEPVRWDLPTTFPHHRKRSVELPVDLWVLTPPPPPT